MIEPTKLFDMIIYCLVNVFYILIIHNEL